MPLVFLLVLFVTVFTVFHYNKDIFSPARIYICIYAILLAVNSLRLSGIQTPWTMTTHMFFWGASFFFIAGSALILLVNRVKNPLAAINFGFIRNNIKATAATTDWTWFYRIWLVCSVLFLASYFASLQITGAIPIFAADPDDARIKFFGASLPSNFGLFFGPLSLILATEMVFFGSFRGMRRGLILTASLATLLLYITIVTRLDLFRFFIFAIIVYHYGKKRLSAPQLLTVAGLSILVFVVFFLLRIKYNSIAMLGEMHALKMPLKYVWCSNFYAYVAGNFWNMDFSFGKFVEDLASHPQGWGFDLMRPFLYLAHMEGGLIDSYGFDSIMNESAFRVHGLNTIIYVWHFFKDFGAFGVYFLPLVFGMLLTVFYVNTVNAPSLFRISMWALIVPMIVFSYLVPLWEFWFTYLNFLVMAIAHRRVTIATEAAP
jgi:oligosaccharide repeat unit polymerase